MVYVFAPGVSLTTPRMLSGAMVDSNALPSIPPAFSVLPRFIMNLSVAATSALREAARASVYEDSSLETTLETSFIICIPFVKKDEAKGWFCASVTESGVISVSFFGFKVLIPLTISVLGRSTLNELLTVTFEAWVALSINVSV